MNLPVAEAVPNPGLVLPRRRRVVGRLSTASPQGVGVADILRYTNAVARATCNVVPRGRGDVGALFGGERGVAGACSGVPVTVSRSRRRWSNA